MLSLMSLNVVKNTPNKIICKVAYSIEHVFSHAFLTVQGSLLKISSQDAHFLILVFPLISKFLCDSGQTWCICFFTCKMSFKNVCTPLVCRKIKGDYVKHIAYRKYQINGIYYYQLFFHYTVSYSTVGFMSYSSFNTPNLLNEWEVPSLQKFWVWLFGDFYQVWSFPVLTTTTTTTAHLCPWTTASYPQGEALWIWTVFKHFSLSSSHPNLFPGAGFGLSQDMEQGSLPRAQFLDKAKQNFQDGRGMNDNACIHSTQTNPGKTVPRPSRGAH